MILCWSCQVCLHWPVHWAQGCSRGMASSIPALTGWLGLVHLKWQSRGGGGGSLSMCCPPCHCDILPHCALCPRVPASLELGRKGHGSVCRELFLPFAIVKWLKLLSSCRWVWVSSGYPAVNHCVRAMLAALMWSMLGVWSNRTGEEWTGQGGFFSQMHCSGCHPWGEMPHVPVDCCLFLVLAAPSLLLRYAKQWPEALQSAS